MKPILFIYHMLWTLIFLLTALPRLLFKPGMRFRERWGLISPALSSRGAGVWIHALSVGEVLSSVPLVDALRSRVPDRCIAFSVTTRQGRVVAEETLKNRVDILFTMPLDFWWAVRKTLNRLRPSIFLLVETDIWPGLLFTLKKGKIPALWVNGRVSPRTYRGYRRFRFFTRRILDTFDQCLMQTDLDRDRVIQIGVREDKVVTSGNIKFEREFNPLGEKEIETWHKTLHVDKDIPLWVAGSTHEGEEEILLDLFSEIRTGFPHLRLIIAPRRIERASDILAAVKERHLQGYLRTGLNRVDGEWDVVVLDTLGELGRLYGLARITFVGGSLVPIGGHNPLEPACFGKPVLYGPHTHNFALMSASLAEYGGGMRVADQKALGDAVKRLLSDPESSREMGDAARAFVKMNQGAIDRVMGVILECLKPL